jgi:hypothetical protein
MALKGSHLQVQGDCGDYDPCDHGVYLDAAAGPDQGHPAQSTAVFKRQTGQRKTNPKTKNVPDNILFIPGLPAGDMDAKKLFRENHPSKAKPEDKKRQVRVSFSEPPNENPIAVTLWQETVGGNNIVHVDKAQT